MMRNSIASKLETVPTGHSDSIMSIRLLLNNEQQLTLFSVYTRALLADPKEKDNFNWYLCRLLQNTPADDKILILGDLNARVGSMKRKSWEAWSWEL